MSLLNERKRHNGIWFYKYLVPNGAKNALDKRSLFT
jgi:hypothetical protein